MTTSSLPPISELLSGFAFNTSPPGTPLELTYSFETSVPTSGSWAFDPTLDTIFLRRTGLCSASPS